MCQSRFFSLFFWNLIHLVAPFFVSLFKKWKLTFTSFLLCLSSSFCFLLLYTIRTSLFFQKKNLIKRKENVSVIWFSSSLIYSPPPLSHCHRLGSVYSTNYITIYIYVAYIYYVAFDILLGNIRRLGTVFSFLRMINNNENQATQIGPLKIDLHFNFAFSNSPVATSSSSVNLIKYNFCLSFDSLFIGEWESKRISCCCPLWYYTTDVFASSYKV